MRVYVAGYIEDKKWFPLSQKGEAFPEEVKCREGVLDEKMIMVTKEKISLNEDSCIYAKSARGAKKKYSDIFDTIVESAEKETDTDETCEEKTATSQDAHSEPLHAIAYTDGSYNKATGQYGYGICMEINGEKSEYFGGSRDMTGGWQVNGELQGALVAIEKAIEAGCSSIEIRYDYEGVHKWADGFWRTNKNYTADYKKKVQIYRKQIHISFTHIKSHTGNEGNEKADDLAKKGAGLVSLNPEEAMPDIPAKRQIGEHVNPVCRKAILAFWKKPKHAFKDFMALKTGGLDAYSRMGAGELRKYADEHNINLSGLPEEKAQLTAIRWILRGLSVDDAIHKVKVDAEVSENANKSRRNQWNW